MTTRPFFARLTYRLRHPLAASGLLACLLALAAVSVAAGTWAAAWRHHQKFDDRVAAKRKLIVQLREQQALQQAVDRARADILVLEGKLGSGMEQARIVDELSQLARQHEVRILNQTYDERRASASAPPALVATLVVQGQYSAVRRFLEELPALPMLCELQEASLESAGAGGMGATGGVKGRLRIAVFRQGWDKAMAPS